MKNTISACCLAAISSCALAQEIKGISFTHRDWEIFCSNTGTCRAAGYQKDEDFNFPASILLTRKAGPKQAVTAEFALSNQEHKIDADKLKNLHFYVNDKDLGPLTVDDAEDPAMGKLSNQQVEALLHEPGQHTGIKIKNVHYQWNISDAGMTAVLLKMDDFQKRIGTQGALVKKGKADESEVLAAQPEFTVKHVITAEKPYLILQPGSRQYKAIYSTLMTTHQNSDDDLCEEDRFEPIELYKLSNQKVLVKTLCWRAAYNEGYGVWVMNNSLTGKAVFVTAMASDYDSGIISSSQKGRGIGDCWSIDEWVWNGNKFVQTKDRWTGMCRALTAGGVWSLDKIEAIVK
ncbi:DUF1176 domain-containing protein [Legionella sp. CNM-4043-24]|uniref:DUF1176 domain-containing protein n=1 Tax=Legionella sp. CNM-4043-24 TaxID=3421646 RepID=UPI00403ABC75